MTRYFSLFAAALFLCALPSGAQTTWHGLSFGMSRDDARNLLSSQGLQFEVNSDGNLAGTNDAQILLPGLKLPVPMRPEVRFTSAGGLMDVTLQPDLTAAKANLTQYRTDGDILTFISDSLTRALAAKYGAPVYTAGCAAGEAKVTEAMGCVTTFRANDQSITIGWAGHGGHLYVRYQMLTPDL